MSAPAHAYELYREYDRELGGVWRLGQSHLYAYLKELEEEGLAEVEVEEQDGRPARRVYRITPSGRRRFLSWLRSPVGRVRYVRLELLARLYFFRRLGLPGRAELMARQRELLELRMAALEKATRDTDDDYWRSVLDFRRSEIGAIVDWIRRWAKE
jgi:Predicted transcriptional regulators